ncbi:DEAD/DEAH box helicase family protein [Primorskyibacter flagellatus]|uniref:restriction endonuclease n=1 Tax=Primorskyibacter flagellatus TaxID=1387277 RepID=UPI003A902C41
MSASGKVPFVRGVVINMTEVSWGANAEEMFAGQCIPVVRLSLTHLRESPIDWTIFGIRGEAVLSEKKKPRPHQIEALDAVRGGLVEADRGKLIMACGTGKTFTSLKIAEDLVGKGWSCAVHGAVSGADVPNRAGVDERFEHTSPLLRRLLGCPSG